MIATDAALFAGPPTLSLQAQLTGWYLLPRIEHVLDAGRSLVREDDSIEVYYDE